MWIPLLRKLVSGGVRMSPHRKWLWAWFTKDSGWPEVGLASCILGVGLEWWGKCGVCWERKARMRPQVGDPWSLENAVWTQGIGVDRRWEDCPMPSPAHPDYRHVSLPRSLSDPSDLVWLLPLFTAAQAPCNISTCILGLPDQISMLRKPVFS